VLLVSTAIVALVTLWQFPSGGKRAVMTLGDETINPNYLAATLVLPAVAAAGLAAGRGGMGWWRWLALAPIALALLLTGSRGGGIALAGGLLIMAAPRRGVGVRIAACALVLAVLLPAIVPQATLDRVWGRYATVEQDRLSGRMDIWRVAFAMAEDRPLQGTAYGGFQDAFYRYMILAPVDPYWARAHSRGNRAAHNIYVSALAELGVPGIVLLVSALAAHGRGLWRARRVAERRRLDGVSVLTLSLLGVFATMLLFGTTIDLLTTKAPWVWLGAMQAATTFVPTARTTRA
jgi:O-antigen ligase